MIQIYLNTIYTNTSKIH